MSNQKTLPERCRDFGEAHCVGTIDPRYTMRFDDLGQPPIHWCSVCGPMAHAMTNALVDALETRGPEFVAEVTEAISEAEKTNRH